MHRQTLDGDRVFAVVDFLDAAECAALIGRAEAGGFEPATVGGEWLPQVRTNARFTFEDAGLAARLWKRAGPFVPAEVEGSRACGLHPRFRVYRYDAAEAFGAHQDGCVELGEAVSRYTFLVYLCDVPAGGETRFYAPGARVRMEVPPRRGQALVFEHAQVHEGAPVRQGRKYVLRTDVLYRPA